MEKFDKDKLIGNCLKLPISFDVNKIIEELYTIPDDLWDLGYDRHNIWIQYKDDIAATDTFLKEKKTRGSPNINTVLLRWPALNEDNLLIKNYPILSLLPFTKKLLYETFGSSPERCVFAKLLPYSKISAHIDDDDYYKNTIRMQIPLVTNPHALFKVNFETYHFKVGEVWALNTGKVHSVMNNHSESRIHLICDYLPNDHLYQLLLDARQTA